VQVETLKYLRAVYAAQAALRVDEISKVRRAAARLRGVGSNNGILPTLDAKVDQLQPKPSQLTYQEMRDDTLHCSGLL
jgi:hypothetical protein